MWYTLLAEYTLGQYISLAQLLPYSAITLLLVGTATSVVLLKSGGRLKQEFEKLPPAIRWSVYLALVLEAIPAGAVALGLGCMFGSAYIALLLGGNESIGLAVGVPWRGIFGFLAMESAAALFAGSVVAAARFAITRAGTR